MTVHADTLIDRIKLKTQLTRWRILAIAIAVISLVVLIESKSSSLGGVGGPIRGHYIARITIDGVIGDNKKLSELIKEVKEDSYAKAVVVWVDSPGGSAVGGQQVYLDLRDLAKDKPVVAVMRSMATSAGYMLSLGADRIFAREGTITGSVGVIMETAEITELAQKLGIKPIVFKSGDNKASPSPIEKLTPEQSAVMQTVIKDFYNWFSALVVERRKLKPEQLEAISDGRVFSGRQALALQLIDQLGGEKEAVEWLEKNKKIDTGLEVEDVALKQEKPSFFDEISQKASDAIFSRSHLGLDGLIAIWHPKLL
jgi:protease-4